MFSKIRSCIAQTIIKAMMLLKGTGIAHTPPFGWIYRRIQTLLRRYAVDVTIETTYGFRMIVDTGGKHIERYLLAHHVREPDNSALFVFLADQTDCFIDVGANIGYFSLLMASLGKEVYAFEPVKRNIQYLSANIRVNNFDQIHLFPVGLGKTSIMTDIFVDPDDPGQSSLLQHQQQIYTEQISIQKFDDLGEVHDAIQDKRLLIKIDVEGYEYDVLQGMSRVLDENQDILLFFEYSPKFYDRIDPSISLQILEFLTTRGFQVYRVGAGGSVHKMGTPEEIYASVRMEYGGQLDLLASRVALT